MGEAPEETLELPEPSDDEFGLDVRNAVARFQLPKGMRYRTFKLPSECLVAAIAQGNNKRLWVDALIRAKPNAGSMRLGHFDQPIRPKMLFGPISHGQVASHTHLLELLRNRHRAI